MVFPRPLLVCCALWIGSEATNDDIPDLSSYSQPCDPFACRPKRAPAPVKDFEFTANGCGTSGMPISTSMEFQDCCNWHDACYSICGMSKAICEKRLHRCMKAKCKEVIDPEQRSECFSTAKIFYIGANMIACPAFQDAQKEACECVPTDTAATATRERLKYFLEENGAPKADLEDKAIDALLAKYKGQEPTMFLRLLKKYPDAIKSDPAKIAFMDELLKDTDSSVKTEEKKKGIKIEKEEPVDEHEDL